MRKAGGRGLAAAVMVASGLAAAPAAEAAYAYPPHDVLVHQQRLQWSLDR